MKVDDTGGEIGVRLDAGPTQVTISVADRGPGIPREDQKTLFAPFRRLETGPAKAGNGLGLYI
jgi:signal transduction histidine kinase